MWSDKKIELKHGRLLKKLLESYLDFVNTQGLINQGYVSGSYIIYRCRLYKNQKQTKSFIEVNDVLTKDHKKRRQQHVPDGAQYDCLDRGRYSIVSGAAPCHQP